MDDKGRPLVEAIHAEARARLAGETLPRSEAGTIHYTELSEAPAGDALFHEWNTYRLEIARLLAEGHEGKFVVVKDSTIVGIFQDEQSALAHGHQSFPRQAFLVHQIREREPILRVRGLNLPCPRSTTPLPGRPRSAGARWSGWSTDD